MIVFARTLAVACLCLSPGAAMAQASDQWQFTIAPYGWGTAIEGHVAHARLPLDVHASLSFGDVLDHLDFGAMGAFEARRGQHGLLVDGLYSKMSTTMAAPVPGVPGASFPVRVKGRTMTALLAYEYRVVDTDYAHVDLLAGARVWNSRTRLAYSLPIPPPAPLPQAYSGEQTETWVDAQVGVKGRRSFDSGFFVGGWVLAGAGESDLSTDAMVMAGYEISDRLSLAAGYRAVSTDFETSSGFRFDTTLQGPGIGLEYHF